jgi:hypothetical protein
MLILRVCPCFSCLHMLMAYSSAAAHLGCATVSAAQDWFCPKKRLAAATQAAVEWAGGTRRCQSRGLAQAVVEEEAAWLGTDSRCWHFLW